jgi:hypothetical protein
MNSKRIRWFVLLALCSALFAPAAHSSTQTRSLTQQSKPHLCWYFDGFDWYQAHTVKPGHFCHFNR